MEWEVNSSATVHVFWARPTVLKTSSIKQNSVKAALKQLNYEKNKWHRKSLESALRSNQECCKGLLKAPE